jgi:hypothetical protein
VQSMTLKEPNFRFARQIGIGEAVARLPLPHHRAYGSVHGGSIGYASSLRLVKEGQAI